MLYVGDGRSVKLLGKKGGKVFRELCLLETEQNFRFNSYVQQERRKAID